MYKIWQKIIEQFNEEQERRFLWVPVLFAIGIGFYFSLSREYSIWWTLAVIEVLIVLAFVFRFKPQILYMLMIISLIVLGFTNIQLKAVYFSKKHVSVTDDIVYLRGRIDKIDYNYKGKQRFWLKDVHNFEQTQQFDLVRISSRYKSSNFFSGQCVELVARLMPAAKPVLPNGYQFDRKSYFEGINSGGYTLSKIYEIDCDKEIPFWEKGKYALDKLRNKIIKRIETVLPASQASIAAAIIAGEQGKIGRELIQNYRNSGLAHFLSISGLHMSMIAGLMFFLVRLCVALIPPLAVRIDSKKPAALFAILISVFYLMISGMQIPVQRAFIMNFIVVLGIFIGRKAISMRTIAWAALFILIISPQALIGASFQMSFAAVVVLVAFYEKYSTRLSVFLRNDNNILFTSIKIVWAYFIGILITDLVASLATLPFAIYHFNKISLYTTMTNLAAGPIIGLLIMPFVLISLLLMPLGLDYWPLKIVGEGIEIVNSITAYVSSLPNAGYKVLSMPLWGLNLIVFGGLWLCLWNKSWRRYGWFLIVLGILSIFTVRIPDVMLDSDASLLAIKNEQGRIVIMPSRGNYFTKQMWLEKTANNELSKDENREIGKIYRGEKINKKLLDLSCNKTSCIYKKRIKYNKGKNLEVDGILVDNKKAEGVFIYLNHNSAKIETVRESIGFRYWNTASASSINN